MTIKGYIDAKETIRNAKLKGITVNEYIETMWNIRGRTKKIIDKLLSIAKLKPQSHCLEIGAGTGRYLSELKRIYSEITCEIYEPNEDWAAWIQEQYSLKGLTRRNPDGYSLKDTKTGTIDLCSAHAVFTYLDTMVTFFYLKEASRCLCKGGYLFFDIIDMDRQDIVTIIDQNIVDKPSYMILLSQKAIINFLEKLHVHLLDKFLLPYDNDFSTYLLFQKHI
ncbi:MAG: class I SAM-dependent methyltransferase [Desulfobacterales bacterium]|nr:class I SAM-dependent methyltransferase [Desulfobacterales bacterium]